MSWENGVIILIGVIGVALQTLALIVAGIWALSKTEGSIMEKISTHKLESEERVNAIHHQTTEMFSAIRAKIQEVELYIRDTYLQKESFRAVIAEIMNDIKNLGDRLESKLVRVEEKIDRAAEKER